MIIGDLVGQMHPWCRMKISKLNQVDVKGNRIWTQALTEAQKLAYWNQNVVRYTFEEDTMTLCCIVEEVANE